LFTPRIFRLSLRNREGSVFCKRATLSLEYPQNFEAALINTGLQPGATDSTKSKPFSPGFCDSPSGVILSEAKNLWLFLKSQSAENNQRCFASLNMTALR
jgi:hypothetical protein